VRLKLNNWPLFPCKFHHFDLITFLLTFAENKSVVCFFLYWRQFCILMSPNSIICNKIACCCYYMTKGLNKRCCNFFYPTPILQMYQMYTTGSVVAYTWSFHSAFSPASSNFYGRWKSVKFGLNLWQDASLSRPHCETKRPIGSKVSRLVQRWWNSVLPNLVQFDRPSPWEVEFASSPPEIAKLSVTQPWTVRFCSNFVETLTTCILQMFKINGSKVKFTALHNVSALKIVTFHDWIGWQFKLCENYPRE